MRYLKGPDFPTGGIVINKDELEEIYETGTGKIKLRGKVEFQKGKAGKTNVVITEIPYTMIGANIAKFLSDVAALSETKKTQDIVDISNQSSKEGIRIVIELRKDADPENFVNMLYKKTRLEDTFGVNMLAIANGRPETMGLKQIIKANVDFQFEVATRKYTNLLAKEMERKEIQEGLIKACNVIDLVIEILRGSKDRAMAKACLVEGKVDGIKFKSKESKIMAAQLMFTEKQANAILEMRLYKLIGLELEALINEHEETMANIYRYEDILDRRDSMAQVIMNELDGFKKEYSHPRKTVIENGQEAVYKEKELEEMDLDTIIRIHPEIVIVDELAHTNVEGSLNEKRWQDVMDILDAGISVITAVNIQHIEGLNEMVQDVVGIEVKERIPDIVLEQADEVVNIDLTADELLARLKAGKIYKPDKIQTALNNFFKAEHILQLRELALKEVALRVEKKVENTIPENLGVRHERFMACISSNEKTPRKIIRKVARLATRYNSKFFVLYVQTPRESSDRIPLASQRHLLNHFKLATELGGEIIQVQSPHITDAIVQVCKEKQISTLCIGRPALKYPSAILAMVHYRNMLEELAQLGIDLIILA